MNYRKDILNKMKFCKKTFYAKIASETLRLLYFQAKVIKIE